MAKSGRLAKVNITGDSVPFTGEATSTSDDKLYTIVDSSKEIWGIDSVITVKEDGVATTENYTLNRLQGEVSFENVDGARGVITVDGDYLPIIEVTEAHEYSISISLETLDNTRFNSAFTTKQAGLKSAEGSLSEFWNTQQYLLKDLIQGNIVVLEFYPDRTETTNYTRIFAIITSDELSTPVADLIDMSISFESTDKMVMTY